MMYDDGIMRTIIDLPDDQVKALAELCKSQSISRAEAVRKAAFGAWQGKKMDSRKFVASLREEWE